MVSACVLICCEAGKYPAVAKKVKDLEGVVRAFSAAGRWDVIAEIGAPDMKALTDIALKINTMLGIRATETLVEASL